MKGRADRQAERTQRNATKNQQFNLLTTPNVDNSEGEVEHGAGRRIQPKISFNLLRSGAKPQTQAAVARCRKALEELYLIVDCDISRGSALSEERTEQIARLSGLYKQLLNVKKGTLADFERDLEAVSTGELYYFALTRTKQHVFDIPNLLSFFTESSGYEVSDDWLDDGEAVRQAFSKLHEFVKTKVLTANHRKQDSLNNIPRAFEDYLITEREDLALYLQKFRLDEKVHLTVYQKSPHKVVILREPGAHDRHSGKLQFKWDHNGTELVIKDLRVPASTVPVVPGEERYISL